MASPTLSSRTGWQEIALIGFLLAMLVGLWSVGAGKDLWYGEQFIRRLAERPIAETVQLLKFENNPPFIFLMTEWWEAVVGGSERALRVISLLPSVLAVLVLYRFTRKAFGREAGLMAATLASVAGLVVTQALELRVYPWVLLWSTLATYYAYQYLSQPTARPLLALTAVSVLGMYTHYTYALIFVGTTAWLFWRMKEYRWPVTWHTVAVAALWLPWVLYSLVPIVQHWQTSFGVQQEPNPIASILFPVRVFVPPLFGEPSWMTVVRLVVSAVVGLSVWQTLQSIVKRTQDTAALSLRWLTVILIGGSLILSLAGLTDPKYATVLVPAVVTIAAVGLIRLPLSAAIRLGLVAMVVAGELAVSYTHAQTPLVTYRAAAAVVEREGRAGDVLVVHPFNDDIVVRKYYRGPLPVYGFLPDRPPGGATLEDNVRRNFRVQVDEANVSRLLEYVKGASRVWFFFDVTVEPGYWNGHLIDAWFSDHNYQKTVYRDIFKNVAPLLIRYDAT